MYEKTTSQSILPGDNSRCEEEGRSATCWSSNHDPTASFTGSPRSVQEAKPALPRSEPIDYQQGHGVCFTAGSEASGCSRLMFQGFLVLVKVRAHQVTPPNPPPAGPLKVSLLSQSSYLGGGCRGISTPDCNDICCHSIFESHSHKNAIASRASSFEGS